MKKSSLDFFCWTVNLKNKVLWWDFGWFLVEELWGYKKKWSGIDWTTIWINKLKGTHIHLLMWTDVPKHTTGPPTERGKTARSNPGTKNMSQCPNNCSGNLGGGSLYYTLLCNGTIEQRQTGTFLRRIPEGSRDGSESTTESVGKTRSASRAVEMRGEGSVWLAPTDGTGR